jgi:hypothetical protein
MHILPNTATRQTTSAYALLLYQFQKQHLIFPRICSEQLIHRTLTLFCIVYTEQNVPLLACAGDESVL